jgi:predicted transcriptional regulator
MSELLTEKQLLSILWDMVAENGGQKPVADLLRITPAYLSDILHERRAISNEVSKKIGYIRKAVFEATK